MSKLTVFNFVTLNGFFKGPDGDISWHKHHNGSEENDFAGERAQSDSILLFGRKTYEMMAGYWPMAMENDPAVAKGMNSADKIVFSRTLEKAEWNNTRLIKDNIVDEIKKLKETSGKDMTILGSGSIVTQFSDEGLIDEYTLMVDPVVLGEGTSIFKGMKHQLELKLLSSRTFKSGIVLLSYEAIKK